MKTQLTVLCAAAVLSGDIAATGQLTGSDHAAEWIRQSAAALGGESTLRSITTVEAAGISVLYQREQSERPEGPWFPTFTEFTEVRHFANRAIRRTSRTRGFVTPDDAEWSPATTALIVDGVGFRVSGDRPTPSATPWDAAFLPVDLGPERILVAALDARDLHSEPDLRLHGYPHHVVAFTHRNIAVKVILNVPSLLPKAIEVTRARPFETYWAPWGDVTQRVTFAGYLLETNGLRYPRIWEFSTDGHVDGTVDITRVRFNTSIAAADFDVPADLRRSAIDNRRPVAELPIGNPQRPAAELAPGVVKVPGSWDIVEVHQQDGTVIIEGPLTSSYSDKVIADAKQRFAGAPIKAAITTSDAWPHIGGMREYAARGVPIYALDLNVPILERLFAAKYVSTPDALARGPRRPALRIVAAKTVVGAGPNRLELYPLRTVSGERQMMVYFPAHKLLYTSDLFTIRDGNVFLPQMVSECVDAVHRGHLEVTAAFGMHYDLLPWKTVVESATPTP